MSQDLSQHPLAQSVSPIQSDPKQSKGSKASLTATTSSAPDLTKPVRCGMVRKTGNGRVLNHEDHANYLAVGRGMANQGKVGGTVTAITWYPAGYVLVTVQKREDRPSYLIIQGDFECEVLP